MMPIIDTNILDFTLREKGTIEALFDVALLNGVGITSEVAPGTDVALPEKTYELRTPLEEAKEPEYVAAAIKERQTVVDYTCQNSGTLEALFELAELNGISITQDLAPGTLLKARPVERKTVRFYALSVLDIVTDKTIEPMPGGIGYMQIGNTFKVS